MALFGVLPRRNPLTDWNKIWHGWLRRGRHSISQMACWSFQGVDPHEGVKC